MDRDFKKLPMDWVIRIFERLSFIFKDKWISSYGNPKTKDINLTQWSSGLSGLTSEEIKKALAMCKSFPHANVPSVVEFYHYAKGIQSITKPPPVAFSEGSREVAKMHMDDIRAKLSIKRSST